MKLLCTGDIHIGRRSTRLPASVDSHAHSTGAAWTRIVQRALAERVDVVAVSGDVIDQSSRYFEAFGTLERGLKKLSDAGVVTVLVSGNHDSEVLPLLINRLEAENVRLLGRGGSWERTTIERDGVRLNIDGWSFAREEQLTSPLATYNPPAGAGINVALLHADLDQTASRYGPISTGELRAQPGTFFLLGHIHKAALIREAGGAQAVYPGSPQALDPGEPGAHGVYLMEARENQLDIRAIPLSTVRYERVQVSVEGIERVEDVDAQIAHEVKHRLIESAAESTELRHMSCRVQLVGATRLHRTLGLQLFDRAADLNLERGNATASIESVHVATRPDRDLNVIAEGSGSAAVIARLLHELEASTMAGGSERLLAEAARLVREIERSGQYLEVLERPERDSDQRERYVRSELNRSASLLLDEMLAQKES